MQRTLPLHHCAATDTQAAAVHAEQADARTGGAVGAAFDDDDARCVFQRAAVGRHAGGVGTKIATSISRSFMTV